MKKDTYILIVFGLVIIMGIGILIGLNIDNKIQNNKETTTYNNSLSSKEIESSSHSKEESVANNEKVKETKKEETQISVPVTTPVVSAPVSETPVSTPVETTPVAPLEEQIIEVPVETVYSDKDKVVIESLESALYTVKNSEVTESFSNSAKKTFIDIVDFLFYNGTIKGYTFDELTDNGKAKVLELANKIDVAIEARVPNYKDKISETATKALNNASKLIKKGSTSLDNFLKEKLSEEDYNSIISSKDDLVYYSKNAASLIKDVGGILYKTAKEKLSSWYAKYRNS